MWLLCRVFAFWNRVATDGRCSVLAVGCDVGVCYQQGSGVAKDEIKGVEWFAKAAAQNHAGAQYNLGSSAR
jgi:TPR repeat protein